MQKIVGFPVFLLLMACIGLTAPTANDESFASPANQGLLSRSAAQTLTDRADAWMKGVQEAENFSGVVLVARNGRLLFARPYGMANLELDVPNTLETKFRLASITKQFTAAAILMLQQRGKLSINDTLCTYFRRLPANMEGNYYSPAPGPFLRDIFLH